MYDNRVKQVYVDAEVATAHDRVQKAIRLEIAIPHDVLTQLRVEYAPLHIASGTRMATQHHHLAAHNRIADHMLTRRARRWDRVLEIGPSMHSAMKFTGNYHGCTLRDARDSARHKMIPFPARGHPFAPDMHLLTVGLPSNTFCVDGAEKCDYQSVAAIANHSMYDIDLPALARIIDQHGLRVIYAWMHLPIELLSGNSANVNDSGYNIKFVGEDVWFSGNNDLSNSYVHNHRVWRNYMIVKGFNTPYGFSVAIEVTRRFGVHCEVTISRITAPGAMYATIQMSNMDLVSVPNLANFIYPRHAQKRNVVTSWKKVEAVALHISSRKKPCQLDEAMAYARSRMSRLVMNETIVDQHWDITSSDLMIVVTTLLFISQRNIARAGMLLEHGSNIIKKATKVTGLDWVPDPLRAVANALTKFFRVTPELMKAGWEGLMRVELQRTPDILIANQVEANAVLLPHGTGWARDIKVPNRQQRTDPPQRRDLMTWRRAHDNLEQYKEELQAQAEKQLRIDDADGLGRTLEAAADAVRTTCSGCRSIDTWYAGPPGSGKTASIITSLTGQAVLYSVPTNVLRDGLKNRVLPPSRVETHHKTLALLSSGEVFDAIVVDECFTVPTAHLVALRHLAPSARIIIAGDEHQIGYIAYNNERGHVLNYEMLSSVETIRSCETRRCPHDIMKLNLMRRKYPGCRSTSNVTSSIRTILTGEHVPGAQLLVFTQEQKQRCVDEAAITVHEAQGMTFPTVVLHYAGTEAERVLLRGERHLVVGLTRHTERLYIRDETSGEVTTAMNGAAQVEAAVGVVGPVDVDQPPAVVFETPEKNKLAVGQADPAGAVDLLQQLGRLADTHECRSICTHVLPWHGQPAVVDLNFGRDPDDRTAYQFTALRGVKETSIKDTYQGLSTLLGRYTKKIAGITDAVAQSDAKIICDSLRQRIKFRGATDEQYMAAVAASLEKMEERGVTLDDLEDVESKKGQMIKFHLKGQQKVMDPNKIKYGQGINAHSKAANLLLSAWVRLLEQNLRENTGTFHYSNGRNEQEEKALIQDRIAGTNFDLVSTDWSEYDSTHNKVAMYVFAEVLRWVGTPEPLVKYFQARCGRRNLVSDAGTVTVNWMLDSGAVWTLAKNTVYSAGFLFAATLGVRMGFFKGDDALLVGENIQLLPERMALGKKLVDENLKLERRKVCSYIGYLICSTNSWCVVDDPVRLATKVYGRCYKNETDYTKYMTAVRDLTKYYRQADIRRDMSFITAAYYETRPEVVDYLVESLVGLSEHTFNDLNLFHGFIRDVGQPTATETTAPTATTTAPQPQPSTRATAPESCTPEGRDDGHTIDESTPATSRTSSDRRTDAPNFPGLDPNIHRPLWRVQNTTRHGEDPGRSTGAVGLRRVSWCGGSAIPGFGDTRPPIGWRDVVTTRPADALLPPPPGAHNLNAPNDDRTDERTAGYIRAGLEQPNELGTSDVPFMGYRRGWRSLHGSPNGSLNWRNPAHNARGLKSARELPADIRRNDLLLQRPTFGQPRGSNVSSVPDGQGTRSTVTRCGRWGDPHDTDDLRTGARHNSPDDVQLASDLHLGERNRNKPIDPIIGELCGGIRSESTRWGATNLDGADQLERWGHGDVQLYDSDDDRDSANGVEWDGYVSEFQSQREHAAIFGPSGHGSGTPSAGRQRHQGPTDEHERVDATDTQDIAVPTVPDEGLVHATQGIRTSLQYDPGVKLRPNPLENVADDRSELRKRNRRSRGHNRQQLRDRRSIDDRAVDLGSPVLQGVPPLRGNNIGNESLGTICNVSTAEGRRRNTDHTNDNGPTPLRVSRGVQQFRGTLREGVEGSALHPTLHAVGGRSCQRCGRLCGGCDCGRRGFDYGRQTPTTYPHRPRCGRCGGNGRRCCSRPEINGHELVWISQSQTLSPTRGSQSRQPSHDPTCHFSTLAGTHLPTSASALDSSRTMNPFIWSSQQ
uniref:RNA-dependent RNA polymerase n=1 Tax=Hepeviridae sp. TaxID=2715178 RepID=A0A6M3YPJ5_9VIRU|nr:MAG: RNA-dependent RNA polymerase [Hepeviridae sp.]